jgi:hypothetical protein
MRLAGATILLGLFAAGLAAMPAHAQGRPDLPQGARIRLVLIDADPSPGEPNPERTTATVHRADADSIAFRLDRSKSSVRVVPWWRVQELDVSEGRRRYTPVEHLGSTAMFTLIGSGVAYASWHSCNDPESDAIWSCIVLPRRLGSFVRFGAWSGFTLGVIDVLVNQYEEQWRSVVRSDGLRLLIDHQPQSGYRAGFNVRF